MIAPLWNEAARLEKYKPIGGTLTTPSQQHLRTLVADLKQRDISFCAERVHDNLRMPAEAAADYLLSCEPHFPWGVRVEGAGFNRMQVHSLEDLRSLEAFYVTGAISTLTDPKLGAALMLLDAHSQEFYKPPLTDPGTFNWGDHRVHKFGLYGAYKEFTTGKQVGSRHLLMAEKCGMGTALPHRDAVVALPPKLLGVEVGDSGLPVLDGLARARVLMQPAQAPAQGAAVDYETLLQHRLPDQPLEQAAEALISLHQALQPRHGWQAGQRAFAFIQDGLRDRRFATQDGSEALRRYLQIAVTSSDMEAAEASLFKVMGADTPRIERGQDRLTINGTSVPVRR